MIPWNLTDAVGYREQLGHHYSHLAGKWRRGGAPTAPSCCRRMCPPFISHCDHQMAAKRFGEWFIARGTSVTWSPRSPYLTPPVFLLGGHVKEGTYKREPRDFPELKTTVTECVRAVTAQGCRRVLVEVRRRVEICLARNGRHSDYLLQFPGRGSNGGDERWIWISNDHGSNLAPNDVCGVINTRAGSERNVTVFSETPCMYLTVCTDFATTVDDNRRLGRNNKKHCALAMWFTLKLFKVMIHLCDDSYLNLLYLFSLFTMSSSRRIQERV